MNKPNEPGYWWCVCNDDHEAQIYLVDEEMRITDGAFYYSLYEFEDCVWEKVRPPLKVTGEKAWDLREQLRYTGGIIETVVLIENNIGDPMVECANVTLDFREGVVKRMPAQATFNDIRHISDVIEQFLPVTPWGHHA